MKILLSDGLLHYADLRYFLGHIHARTTTSILDVCHAGAFVRHRTASIGADGSSAMRAWLKQLATATPGTRLLGATPANGFTREDHRFENGRWTRALLDSLSLAPGDIPGDGVAFISDVRAFQHARALVARRYPDAELPVAERLTGDLPMSLSQRAAPVGEAQAVGLQLRYRGVSAEFAVVVSGRRHVPTTVRCRVVGAGGVDYLSEDTTFEPSDDEYLCTGHTRFEGNALSTHPSAGYLMATRGSVRVRWIVEVLDGLGRRLAAQSYPFVYSPAPSPFLEL